jgi:hypothetical protein
VRRNLYSTDNATQSTQTMTNKILQSFLIGALLSACSAFADSSIQISRDNGMQRAAFSLGDSKCVLVDETIRCTPMLIASN